MKVWASFYGGSSYSPGEYEEFDSIDDVVREYGAALRGEDPDFPCVSKEAEVLVCSTDPWHDEDAYPFLILSRGPRGGIKRDRC